MPNPGEPPKEPGDPVPIPGDMVPGDPEKDPGEDVQEPGEGVPDELGIEPAPSGTGRLPDRDSSYAFRYQLSGEKDADLVGEASAIPYLRFLVPDLSLWPVREVILKVREKGTG